jgi:hypothetical protein
MFIKAVQCRDHNPVDTAIPTDVTVGNHVNLHGGPGTQILTRIPTARWHGLQIQNEPGEVFTSGGLRNDIEPRTVPAVDA